MMLLIGVVISGCSTQGDKYPYKGPRCLDTCPRSCIAAEECVWALNEICCDFDGVKACAVNTACPRFCENENTCDSTEVCCRTVRESYRKKCTEPKNCLIACTDDKQCAVNQQICCTVLNTPVCTNSEDCQTACSTDDTCKTTGFCCKTVKDNDPYDIFSVSALCRNPSECPWKCSQDADCTTVVNEKCCQGLCTLATECNSCVTQEDCKGKICCDNKVLDSPWYNNE
jgi:hypothetical protein